MRGLQLTMDILVRRRVGFAGQGCPPYEGCPPYVRIRVQRTNRLQKPERENFAADLALNDRSMLADLRFVLFDAAGTLIRAVPDVAVVYQQVGARYGACLNRDVIERRFQRAFRQHMTESAATERHTNDEIERLRWRQVVAEVFPEIDHAGLFRELWNHFARSENWQLFHDVEPAWRQLEEAGLLLGVASNFDRRLLDICQGLPLFSDCRYVFASTALGRRKPALQFFRRIEEHLGAAPEQIMLVGDDLLADWRGAQSAGWRAILIDRNRTTGHHDAIHDLRELAQLLAG